MGLGVAAAGGGAPERLHLYRAHLTVYVVIVCVIAASGGLLFGYDLGVTSGVMSMPSFLALFFPDIGPGTSSSPWCTYSDPKLQLFTSSLFLAAMVSTLAAAWLSSRGRKLTMLVSGLCFLAGVGLCAGAPALAALICGRLLLGCGIGLANQCVPVYLSEMAPPQIRGMLNITFQLATTFGLMLAQLVNLGTAHLEPWGWRLSIALAGAPALVLVLGALLLPETPCSLAERGRDEEARAVLERLRGTKEVDEELADILAAAEHASGPWSGWRQLFSRGALPELISGCAVAAFSQANGINAILFYTPTVFNSLQLGQHAALLSATVIGGTLFLGTLVSMVLVDRVGRRPLLLQGGLQMLLSLAGVAAALGAVSRGWAARGAGAGAAGAAELMPPGAAAAVLVFICLFVAGFSWSWGPLGWLIPSEITPLQIRSCGQSLFTCVNFAVAFAGTQMFMTLMCSMEWGVYIFFGAWVVLMVAYAAWFLPETKGVPIEQMGQLWEQHWFWRRFAGAGSAAAVAGKGGLPPA